MLPPYVTNRDDPVRKEAQGPDEPLPPFPYNPFVGLGVQDEGLADVADWSDLDDLVDERLRDLAREKAEDEINKSDLSEEVKKTIIEGIREMAQGNISQSSEDESEDSVPQAETDQGRQEPKDPNSREWGLPHVRNPNKRMRQWDHREELPLQKRLTP